MLTLGVLVRVNGLLFEPDQKLALAPDREVPGLEYLEQAGGLFLEQSFHGECAG